METDICRLCLGVEATISLFRKDDEVLLYSKVMSIANTHINPGDGLPDRICGICCKKLENCLLFKKQCEKSDFKLRTLLKRGKSEITGDICGNIEKQEELSSQDVRDAKLPNNDIDRDIHTEILFLNKDIHKGRKTKAVNKQLEVERDKAIKQRQKQQCSTCGQVLSSKFRLQMHLRIHSGEKPHACLHCDKKFAQLQYLKEHMKRHTGEKPLECSVCRASFAHSAGLVAHRSLHTGETPYACTLCPRRFRTRGHLNYHIRRHTGDESFECDVCSRAFITRSALKQHLLSHTGEKPYICSECGLRFTRAWHLTRHVKHRHRNEKPFECEKCSLKFAQKFDFERHVKTHGGKNYENKTQS